MSTNKSTNRNGVIINEKKFFAGSAPKIIKALVKSGAKKKKDPVSKMLRDLT